MSKNNLQIFENKDYGKIRTMLIENNTWFVGKDIADILGYNNTRDALLRHVDKDDKTTVMISDTGSNYKSKTTLINESGLYSLILSSKLPKAKEFKKWVTSEVLPTIRKTGGYVDDKEMFVNTYLPFADENTKNLFKLQLDTIQQLNTKIKTDKPLVDFAHRVGDTTDLIDVGAFAKILRDEQNIKVGRTKLFAWLRDNKFLRKNNEPYQKWINQGYFKLREYTYMNYGMPQIGLKTYITGKGQKYLTRQICKSYSVPV